MDLTRKLFTGAAFVFFLSAPQFAVADDETPPTHRPPRPASEEIDRSPADIRNGDVDRTSSSSGGGSYNSEFGGMPAFLIGGLATGALILTTGANPDWISYTLAHGGVMAGICAAHLARSRNFSFSNAIAAP